MLYGASTVSLCCLEVLVHTDPDLIPDNLVWSWAELPADPEELDYRWDVADVGQTRVAGKSWIDSVQSLAILVQSVIVPHTDVDFNILLNPAHPAYHGRRSAAVLCELMDQNPGASCRRPFGSRQSGGGACRAKSHLSERQRG
jgi:RES domain-containing protein